MESPLLLDLLAWLRQEHPRAGIARVEAGADANNNLVVVIYTSRPGLLIGRQGAKIAELKERLGERLESVRTQLGLGPLGINLVEIRRGELEPLLVADDVLLKLSSGVQPEDVLARIAQMVIRAGGRGVRLSIFGAITTEHTLYAEGATDLLDERAQTASVEGDIGAGVVRCEVTIAGPGV